MNSLFLALIIPGTLCVCRGIDGFAKDVHYWLMRRLGTYETCKGCNGLGVCLTGKPRRWKR